MIAGFTAVCLSAPGVLVAVDGRNRHFRYGPITDLRAGPLGLILVLSSILFLLGTFAFAISLALGKGVPRLPLFLYFIGAVPIGLRAFVPEWTLDLGLAVLAGAIAWLAGECR
jgi:hypothetical protein